MWHLPSGRCLKSVLGPSSLQPYGVHSGFLVVVVVTDEEI